MFRVLQIVDNLSKDAGVSSFLMNIYRNIDRTRVQFDFLITPNSNSKKKDNYKKDIEELGGKVFELPSVLEFKSVLSGLRAMNDFFKINKGCYSIVHVHTPTLGAVVLWYAKKAGIEHRILHSHSTMTSPNKVKAVINNGLMWCAKRFTTDRFACSTEAGEFLYKSRDNITILHNAVDINKFYYDVNERRRIREKFKIGSKIVVAHVSNFSPIKNHIFLVDVIKKTIEKKTGFMFLFLGDGETKESFINELRDNNLEDFCIFTGKVNDVEKYLQAADLLILPSIREGLPVTVVEAQATGLPCLVSNTVTKECDTGLTIFAELVPEIWESLICKTEISNDEERNQNAVQFTNTQYNAVLEAGRIALLYEKMFRDCNGVD